jgi:hypothetical protein
MATAGTMFILTVRNGESRLAGGDFVGGYMVRLTLCLLVNI